MHHGKEVKRKPNPKENANFLSKITFLFTFGFLKKGYKRDLTENDIYAVLPKLNSKKLGDHLEREWLREKTSKKKPSIYRLLWTCYGKYYAFLGIIQLIMKIIMVIFYPEALGKLVSYFTPNTTLSSLDAIYYAFVVIFLNLLQCTYGHNYMLLITELGITIKTAFCSLIYRKSLKMSNASLSKIGIGRIVTLISKDVDNFEHFIIFLNDIWISIILLIIASYKMYYRMGAAALVGILFLILIIPLQVWLGQITTKLRIEAAKMTDHRLQTTQESLSAIKIIKMYTWENFFIDRISKARKNEMEKIKRIYFARAAFLEIGSLVTSLATYIIVMTYTKLGNKYTAEIDSFRAGCFHILRSPITLSIPLGIVNLAELVASVRRIHTVLVAEEEEFINILGGPSIVMENVSVRLNDRQILQSVSLKIESGLYFVTGKVGSGKSSLLKTIIQSHSIEKGEMKIQGAISYASQEPWLFPSSIKQNILFGQVYNQERYAKVLKVCALETDLASFLDGDETIIKDRGLNLSKGQQSRINLARAVYRDSDIYLLDDNLSSLDTHLQDFVFRECIKKILGNKIVIVVSHNEKLIKQGDKIIIMDRGTIKSCLDASEANGDLSEFPQHEKDEFVIKEPEDRNIYHEKKKDGKVDINVFRRYCQHGGGILIGVFILGLYIVAQVASVSTDKLLSTWVNIQQKISETPPTNTTEYRQISDQNETMSGYYTMAILASVFFFFSRAYTHFKFASKASLILHNSMVVTIVNATMKFFDLHYIGNILNRCAKDFRTIDEVLPFNSYEVLKFVCRLVGSLILILHVNILFAIPASIVIILLLLIRNFYIPSGRSLKRLDSATRSPVIGHVNASLEGLSIIKAHRNQETLQREFDMHQNLYTSANYMLQSSVRAFGYFLDLLCQSFTATIIIIFLFVGKNIQAGNIGLAIRQSLGLNGLLQWGIRQWADLESHMTSVERVLEYTNADVESRTGLVLEDWPHRGKITFKNVSLTYGSTKDYVLKNIDFTIQPGEKIGVVGRTGVGKTSLISLLFRLYDYQGTITIDNVDIRTLTLDFLRTNISVISQDPVLFSGTIRKNIDPTDCYQDEEIWEAINAAHLKQFIPSLYTHIIDGGSNFSCGQKQLICLARAVIKNSKIVILDEATANVDLETDLMIRNVIKQSFDSCTVITVAHRLQTIMDCDRVMVVDKGEVVEFDDPKELTTKEESYFYKMFDTASNY